MAGFAYGLDNVLHLGSDTIALPQGATIEKFSRLQGGAVVVSWVQGSGTTTVTQVLDAKGRKLADLGDIRGWAVSRDRARIASWDGRTVRVLDSAAKVLASRGVGSRPIDIIGDDVYLVGDSGSQEWNFVTGRSKTMPQGPVAVSPSRDRAAIVYPTTPDSLDSCWAVVDLSSSRFKKLVAKCSNVYAPSAFSAGGTYLIGKNMTDGGLYSSFAIVRVATGKAVFGGDPNSADDKAGWSVRLGGDERTIWFSANTSPLGVSAKSNSLKQCTIGAGCSEIAPSMKTPRSQPRYVVESPSSD